MQEIRVRLPAEAIFFRNKIITVLRLGRNWGDLLVSDLLCESDNFIGSQFMSEKLIIYFQFY